MSRIKGLTKRQDASVSKLLEEHVIHLISSFKKTNQSTQDILEIALVFNLKSKKIEGVFFNIKAQKHFIFDPISNQYQLLSKVNLSDYVFLVKADVCEEFEVFEEYKNIFINNWKITYDSWDEFIDNFCNSNIAVYLDIEFAYNDIVKSYPKSFRAEKIADVLDS